VRRPSKWSHLPTGSPGSLLPLGRFARCAIQRYASLRTCRPSANV